MLQNIAKATARQENFSDLRTSLRNAETATKIQRIKNSPSRLAAVGTVHSLRATDCQFIISAWADIAQALLLRPQAADCYKLVTRTQADPPQTLGRPPFS